MDDEVKAALLAQAKRKLRIDAADTADDERIGEAVAVCAAYLAERIGVDEEGFDWSAPGRESALLMNAVLYEWNDALDDFWANYAAEVETARIPWMVRQYAAEQEAAEGSQ